MAVKKKTSKKKEPAELTQAEIFHFERLELKRDIFNEKIKSFKAFKEIALHQSESAILRQKLATTQINSALKERGEVEASYNTHKKNIQERLGLKDMNFGYDDVTGEVL